MKLDVLVVCHVIFSTPFSTPSICVQMKYLDYLPLIQSIMSWEPCCTMAPSRSRYFYLSGLKIKSQTTLNIHVHVIISKNLWQISINFCTHDPQRSKWHLLIRDPKLWVKEKSCRLIFLRINYLPYKCATFWGEGGGVWNY